MGREAEADAEPLLLGAGYAGLAGAAIAAPAIATTAYAAAPAIATTAYAAPIAVAKSAPCVNAANVPVPCHGGAVLAAPAIAAPAIAAPAIAAPAIATTGLIGGYSTLGGHYYGKGRPRPSPTLATPVLATLVLATDTLVPTATANLPPVSTLPTSPSLAGDSTRQTSTANFVIHSALKNENDTVWCQFSSRKN